MDIQGESLIPRLINPEVFPTITQPTEVDPFLAIGIPTVLIPLSQEQLPIILAERVVFPIDLIEGFMLSSPSVSATEGLGYLLEGVITARAHK